MTSKSLTQSPWLPVLAGGAVIGVALGIRHVQGLFLVPVTMGHGWTRETFGLAIALQNLIWGAAQPFSGMLADRYGAAKVVVAGIVVYALGLLLMAHAGTPLGFTLSAGGLIGLGLSGTSFGVVYGAISRLTPPERRSWALGVAGAVGGVGQFVMVPTAQGLLGTAGWVMALVILAAVMALSLPLAAPLRERASTTAVPGAHQSMGAAIREAFAHPGFWLLNLGFLTCGFQLAFIGAHMPAYLLDKGLTGRHGMVALALIAAANIVGTYCCGVLGGLFRRKYLLSLLYLIRTGAIALFILLPLSPATLYAFAIVMGLLWLGTVPLTNGLLSQVFGVRYIGTLFGFVFLGHQVGAFLGVWLGGVVYDRLHSYDAIWFGAMVLGVVAALLHWPIDDRQLARTPMALPA
ncbi:MFS transporter [Ralstonia mannitolilytica]|uniref:Inner membrane protein yhjX n=1 Tax=Ralstonia mannitolilytica TaxID=105219 RepID=A0AAJ4ZKZ7_9RALS|nr:MFS transporter [Ralstonia mannitolilytica]CAG2139236.1 L-lactate transporter [Ralstonia mannitolilytica]CAJ0724892.1 L-lactate transporter [Ralstonia mannitolilytica]SUD87723.1 Inner membrane protein yhjX [Ralstonia mannitolilytica]SUD93633.1 Inner membrane protein yhjX [Ralstonia mannitolilytica]SUD97383.1 Inner membrane protein yhjX [Ralstonia mannitolilytica]